MVHRIQGVLKIWIFPILKHMLRIVIRSLMHPYWDVTSPLHCVSKIGRTWRSRFDGKQIDALLFVVSQRTILDTVTEACPFYAHSRVWTDVLARRAPLWEWKKYHWIKIVSDGKKIPRRFSRMLSIRVKSQIWRYVLVCLSLILYTYCFQHFSRSAYSLLANLYNRMVSKYCTR